MAPGSRQRSSSSSNAASGKKRKKQDCARSCKFSDGPCEKGSGQRPEPKKCRSAAERARDCPAWPFEASEAQPKRSAKTRALPPAPEELPQVIATKAIVVPGATAAVRAPAVAAVPTKPAPLPRAPAASPAPAVPAPVEATVVDKSKEQQSQERREREYYKASFGEPCGPENRFLVESEIGRGAFSTVYRCKDTKAQGRECAVKFIRANVALRKATELEVKLMRRLRVEAAERDPSGAKCLLSLAGPETFEHNGHLALVFPLQRCSVHFWLQSYARGRGLPFATVQSYSRDLLLALRALRRLGVVHNDLKPDNLLMSLDKASVKLCDFGCAFLASERQRAEFVRPVYCSGYRAPEVVLGQKLTSAVDVWSAGATIFELATSQRLFTEKTNNGVLHGMLRVCGPFPKRLATSGKGASKHFTSSGDFKLKDQNLRSGEFTLPMSQFAKPARPVLQLLQEAIGKQVQSAGFVDALKHLAELLAKCLTPSPAERVLPERALGHAFFQALQQQL